jgi:hypothetical protein
VTIQQYFRDQVVNARPVRLMLFVHALNRAPEFRVEPLSPAQAVSWLMHEYISQQKAQEGDADYMFDIFSDMASQSASYRLWLTPDPQVNANSVRALLQQHA